MINYKILKDKSILILSPNSVITEKDFDNISKDVDLFLEKNNFLEGVVIYAKEFNGWENLSSLINHLKFVKDHHKYIKKIAFVTNDKILSILPQFVKHFVYAEIKTFNYEEKDNALVWIVERKSEEHGISIGINQINNIFYIKMEFKGTLTHKDYEIMIPIIEDTIKNVPHPKLKILVNALHLKGWELEAAWDDLKFGLKHNKEFDKIAYVGTKTWEEYGVKLSSWFLSGEMKFFENEHSAKEWLLNTL